MAADVVVVVVDVVAAEIPAAGRLGIMVSHSPTPLHSTPPTSTPFARSLSQTHRSFVRSSISLLSLLFYFFFSSSSAIAAFRVAHALHGGQVGGSGGGDVRVIDVTAALPPPVAVNRRRLIQRPSAVAEE